MSYHLSRRKPRAKAPAKPLPIWPRVVIGAFGACLVVWGMNEFKRGRLVGISPLLQLGFSTTLMGIGGLMVLLALAPRAWLDRAARRLAGPRPTVKRDGSPRPTGSSTIRKRGA
jgi:hypothetical protein